jgi:hypothetical protein
MLLPSIERFLNRSAAILSSVAWVGLIYTYWRFSTLAQIGGWDRTVVPANLWSLTTLICALFGLLCGIPRLADDIGQWSTWGFIIWCLLPFVVMLKLLYPLPLFFHLR